MNSSTQAGDAHPPSGNGIVAEGPVRIQLADLTKEDTEPSRPDGATVAVFVCHGMGQQVKFQTLMDVERVLARGPAQIVGPAVVRRVRFERGDEVVCETSRTELTLERDQVRRRVHVYEGYWAPVTEGKVGVWDVMKFLIRAAWDGSRNANRETFDRWAFGRMNKFDIKKTKTRRRLLQALTVILSLILINTAIGVIGSARLLQSGRATWPSDRALVLLGACLLVEVVLLALTMVTLAVLQRRRKAVPPAPASAFQLRLAGNLLGAALVGTVAVALAIGGILLTPADWLPALLEMTRLVQIGLLALWLMTLILSRVVRYFLIQYMGDVVAYVSAHTVNRFAEIREDIQKLTGTVAKAIYSARSASGGYEYGRIVVVGHSLGSVVAYDVLNAVVRDDLMANGRLRAAERTPMLLTFGSPLNKTAYLFRTQMPAESGLREALAGTMQPLIDDYAHRPKRWVNVYSNADWISGRLEFYDKPLMPGAPKMPEQSKRVDNVPDPDAVTPLAAHTEYWSNRTIADVLVDGIFC